MSLDTSCLYTVIKNTSGVAKTFGFLPPHGKRLDVDEEFSIFGDIRQALGTNRGSERSSARQALAAFEEAISRGDLEILSTPNPILVDTVTDASKMVAVTSGSVVSTDPCWYNSESE